jgi:hypothetical protein
MSAVRRRRGSRSLRQRCATLAFAVGVNILIISLVCAADAQCPFSPRCGGSCPCNSVARASPLSRSCDRFHSPLLSPSSLGTGAGSIIFAHRGATGNRAAAGAGGGAENVVKEAAAALAAAGAADASSTGTNGPTPVLAPLPDVAIDGAMTPTLGGSLVVERKGWMHPEHGWAVGQPIDRPRDTKRTVVSYVALPREATGGEECFLRIAWAAVSKQGRGPRPPHKPNQDSFAVAPALGAAPSLFFAAVFDGHGPRGEDASNFARIRLPALTTEAPNFAREPFRALGASFEACHAA